MSLNDKQIADKLRQFFSQSNLTRSGSDVYADGEKIPVGGGEVSREQVVKSRRVKKAEESEKSKIKYVYVTGGSNPNRTALCVAGYKQGWTFQIDEWNNSEYILLTATIDNLGGSDFIVSYVLGRMPSPRTYNYVSYNCVFKVARQSGNTFSREISDKYYPGLVMTSIRLPNENGFTSVGYGNWLSGAITDLSNFGQSSGRIFGENVFRLSDLSINTSISTELDILPYDRVLTDSSGYFGYAQEILPGYTYLNPETTYNGYILVTPVGRIGDRSINRRRDDTPVCVRYNAATGKSLSFASVNDYQFYNDLIVYGDYGEGTYRGWILKPSRGSVATTIKFYGFVSGPPYTTKFPPYADYYADINCTLGSDVATITGGVVPAVGTLIRGDFGVGAAIVLEASGNTIRLSEKSTNTTDLPDNPTSIGWGFPSSYSGYNLGGYRSFIPTIDLLSNGVSYFSSSHLNRYKPGIPIFEPQLKTEKIDCYVSLFGDDLLPAGYKKVTVYPPTILNPGASQLPFQNAFSIQHASYNPK